MQVKVLVRFFKYLYEPRKCVRGCGVSRRTRNRAWVFSQVAFDPTVMMALVFVYWVKPVFQPLLIIWVVLFIFGIVQLPLCQYVLFRKRHNRLLTIGYSGEVVDYEN